MQKEEPAKKGIKWLIGLLLLSGIIGGGFLIYRWWTKPTPEQVEQNKKHKKILTEQIQEIESVKNSNRAALEKAKKGEEHPPWETIDEFPKSPPFDSTDKELVELNNKKHRLIEEWNKLIDEWTDNLKNQKKSLWERQKNGQWKMLTERLDKSLATKAQFDKFIKTFYQRFGEKKGIKIHEPRIKFYGFGHFYVKEEELISQTSEMGHTTTPKEDEYLVTDSGGKITHYPMEINLNQIFLLNHGTIGMDKFYRADPETSEPFRIDFDQMTETIAHELAHALQNVINIDNYRRSTHENALICSQCASSGEKDANGNPLHPDWTAEHAKLTTEIEQMIKSSSEYQEFERWWKSSN